MMTIPQAGQEEGSNCLGEEGREGRPPLLPVDCDHHHNDYDDHVDYVYHHNIMMMIILLTMMMMMMIMMMMTFEVWRATRATSRLKIISVTSPLKIDQGSDV